MTTSTNNPRRYLRKQLDKISELRVQCENNTELESIESLINAMKVIHGGALIKLHEAEHKAINESSVSDEYKSMLSNCKLLVSLMEMHIRDCVNREGQIMPESSDIQATLKTKSPDVHSKSSEIKHLSILDSLKRAMEAPSPEHMLEASTSKKSPPKSMSVSSKVASNIKPEDLSVTSPTSSGQTKHSRGLSPSMEHPYSASSTHPENPATLSIIKLPSELFRSPLESKTSQQSESIHSKSPNIHTSSSAHFSDVKTDEIIDEIIENAGSETLKRAYEARHEKPSKPSKTLETSTDISNLDINKPTLVFYGSVNCHICREFMPVWKDLVLEAKHRFPNLQLVHFEIGDDLKKIELARQVGVDAYPTLLLYTNSKILTCTLRTNMANVEGISKWLESRV